VTIWGIVALVCWGGAVLLANISAVIPSSVFAGLHASRLDGGTVAQLRTQVATLSEESQRMRRENNLLLQRFDMTEEQDREITRRVGALEISLPARLETRTGGVAIDDTAVTASIGQDGRMINFDADGGSVSVVQKPLVNTSEMPAQVVSSTPEQIAVDPDAFGIALGFPVAPEDAEAQWQSLAAKVGTLLLGLAPLLAEVEGSDGVQIIAGPVTDRAQAEELCVRMDRVGIPCSAKPFAGEPLPLLN
jgi:cell division protein FtsB